MRDVERIRAEALAETNRVATDGGPERSRRDRGACDWEQVTRIETLRERDLDNRGAIGARGQF